MRTYKGFNACSYVKGFKKVKIHVYNTQNSYLNMKFYTFQ